MPLADHEGLAAASALPGVIAKPSHNPVLPESLASRTAQSAAMAFGTNKPPLAFQLPRATALLHFFFLLSSPSTWHNTQEPVQSDYKAAFSDADIHREKLAVQQLIGAARMRKAMEEARREPVKTSRKQNNTIFQN